MRFDAHEGKRMFNKRLTPERTPTSHGRQKKSRG